MFTDIVTFAVCILIGFVLGFIFASSDGDAQQTQDDVRRHIEFSNYVDSFLNQNGIKMESDEDEDFV